MRNGRKDTWAECTMSTYFIKIARGDWADVENSTETMKWDKKFELHRFLLHAGILCSSGSLPVVRLPGTYLWVLVGTPSLTCINHFVSHWQNLLPYARAITWLVKQSSFSLWVVVFLLLWCCFLFCFWKLHCHISKNSDFFPITIKGCVFQHSLMDYIEKN